MFKMRHVQILIVKHEENITRVLPRGILMEEYYVQLTFKKRKKVEARFKCLRISFNGRSINLNKNFEFHKSRDSLYHLSTYQFLRKVLMSNITNINVKQFSHPR